MEIQQETIQTENNQIAESEHNLMRELESMSVEVNDLNEKLESTSSENETLKKQLKITQKEMDQRTTTEADNLTLELESMSAEVNDLKKKLESTCLGNETLAKKLESADTMDPSFDNDTPEHIASQAEESAMDDETPESINFSISNSADELEKKTLVENNIQENLDVPSNSLTNDKEPDLPDVVALGTILEILRGFADINKRLLKIAESRNISLVKDPPEDSKGKDSRNT